MCHLVIMKAAQEGGRGEGDIAETHARGFEQRAGVLQDMFCICMKPTLQTATTQD